MGEVIRLNTIGFPHIICAVCDQPYFLIKSEDDKFYSIICVNCGNEIFCNLQPVFGPAESEDK